MATQGTGLNHTSVLPQAVGCVLGEFLNGPTVYADAVDQLLNNLTVRDSHAALLIFSRRKDFGTVEDRMREATMEHDRYVSKVPEIADHGVYRLEVGSGRPVRVAVKAFDVRK